VDRETLRGGRYVVTGTLGEGSQGATFEAVDKKEGRLVAIKCFDVRGARAWKDVELAEREARVLAGLSHRRLPAYIEHFEEDGKLYLVMEKIEGKSLATKLRDRERLDERQVARLLADAADALAYLHGRGIVHRDLKPGNVIARPDGSFAFVDFGAVRDGFRAEGGSTVVGTFGYMAPEQFQGRALPASDVYAIGATSLALLTGKQPEELPHRGLAIDVAASLRGVASDALARTLARMLEPDPERRASRVEVPSSLGAGPRSVRARPPPSPREEREMTRKEARRARKEARRARREARLHRGGGRLPWIALLFVLLGLAVARVAVSVALFVIVPAVLTTLSLVFGPALRDAARAVVRGGKRAYGAIDEQAREVAGRTSEPPPPAENPRVRVEGERVRVAGPRAEEEEEEEWEEEEEEERRRRS
jgi:hypothetical protein